MQRGLRQAALVLAAAPRTLTMGERYARNPRETITYSATSLMHLDFIEFLTQLLFGCSRYQYIRSKEALRLDSMEHSLFGSSIVWLILLK